MLSIPTTVVVEDKQQVRTALTLHLPLSRYQGTLYKYFLAIFPCSPFHLVHENHAEGTVFRSAISDPEYHSS